jgi:signal transduction histidine kinase/HAMP domain-containing protein
LHSSSAVEGSGKERITVRSKRRTLRRRLNTVLLQWFLLLVVASGAVLAISFAGVRRNVVDDRLLLGRTIAHYLDATVSTAIQDLGRLSLELPALDAGAAARLRVFRFQSPFREATYVVDERGAVVVGDPADTRPLPTTLLGPHESVTPLLRKAGSEQRPVLAMIQPFRRDTRSLYLVSEMQPLGSIVSAFLQDLGTEADTHVAVIDDNGVVIASSDQGGLFHTLPSAGVYRERIRAHRPLISEDLPCEFPRGCDSDVLTVVVPLRLAPWGVVIKQDKATAFSAMYTARRGLLVAGAMLALMGLFLARALSRSVVAPIRQLSWQAERIRAGDLTSPITVTGDLEVEVLAETLDEARGRLASTLTELRALNEDLERQVAHRTSVIEAKYRDLSLLHAVAQLSAQERELDVLVPDLLRLIAGHYGVDAAAIVARPSDGAPATYAYPSAAVVPWLAAGETPPPDWQRHDISYGSTVQAQLYHPRADGVDTQVREALEHELAIALHGAYLWKRTLAHDEQRQVLVRRLLSATEEERRRLARELHDEIAQLLTVIQLSLERVDPQTAEIEKARGLLTQTQIEIHRIIHDLRPTLLDDLGLPAAMKSYAADHLTAAGVAVSLEIDDALPSRPEIEIATFRIYQEIVTNIVRHARADTVSIELYERDGRLVLAVEDDGVGFDPGTKSEGAGIVGMRERAALVNGTIEFDSEPGMGTHIVVEIPIR